MPAPEFDCLVDMESGIMSDVVLLDSSDGTVPVGLHVEANLSSVPLGLPRKPLAVRKSSRNVSHQVSPPLLDDDAIKSGLSHPSSGQYYIFE